MGVEKEDVGVCTGCPTHSENFKEVVASETKLGRENLFTLKVV
jgi:hypothetical protein